MKVNAELEYEGLSTPRYRAHARPGGGRGGAPPSPLRLLLEEQRRRELALALSAGRG